MSTHFWGLQFKRRLTGKGSIRIWLPVHCLRALAERQNGVRCHRSSNATSHPMWKDDQIARDNRLLVHCRCIAIGALSYCHPGHHENVVTPFPPCFFSSLPYGNMQNVNSPKLWHFSGSVFGRTDFFTNFIFGPPDFFSWIFSPDFFSWFLWEKVPRKILQANPRQNPPKILQQKSPTHFCRGAGPTFPHELSTAKNAPLRAPRGTPLMPPSQFTKRDTSEGQSAAERDRPQDLKHTRPLTIATLW